VAEETEEGFLDGVLGQAVVAAADKGVAEEGALVALEHGGEAVGMGRHEDVPSITEAGGFPWKKS
jgi:hypothetical protein